MKAIGSFWESGHQVLKLWNNVQKAFGNRSCIDCRSRDVDIHITNNFGKPLIIVACWDCGGVHPVAQIRER